MEGFLIAKYGGWRTTSLYESIESEVLCPLYRCRFRETCSKPLDPWNTIYPHLKHRIRHVKRQVEKLHEMWFIKRIFNSIEIELLEYLLNNKSGEIWFVPTHHRHSLVVNMVYRWWRKYYDMVFETLETYYNITYRLLNIIYPFYAWDHDYHIDLALECLEKFLRDIYRFNIFIKKVKKLSDSNLTKREKEYWLLQLKNILYDYTIVEEFKVDRFIGGKLKKITFYRLNLNVREVLRDTMERVMETLEDAYRAVVKKESQDHLPNLGVILDV